MGAVSRLRDEQAGWSKVTDILADDQKGGV